MHGAQPEGDRSLGIFCIENWTGDLRSKSTVLPLLEFARDSFGPRIRFIHQRISTFEELEIYMDRWSALDSYQLGFLALHGGPGQIAVGADSMTVRDLLDRTWENGEHPWVIDLSGKVLYLGSCSTLSRKTQFERIAKDTGARMVCGYRRAVRWDECAAFEVMLLSALAEYLSPFDAVRDLRRRQFSLVERLKFDWTPRRTTKKA